MRVRGLVDAPGVGAILSDMETVGCLVVLFAATPGNTSPKRSSSIRSRTSRPKSVENPRRGCNSEPAGQGICPCTKTGRTRSASSCHASGQAGRSAALIFPAATASSFARDQLDMRWRLESRVHQPAVADQVMPSYCGKSSNPMRQGRRIGPLTELHRNHGGFLGGHLLAAVRHVGCLAAALSCFALCRDGPFCPQDANPARRRMRCHSLTSVCQLPDLAVPILRLRLGKQAPDRPSGPVPLPGCG